MSAGTIGLWDRAGFSEPENDADEPADWDGCDSESRADREEIRPGRGTVPGRWGFRIFHSVENFFPQCGKTERIFPRYGKLLKEFSTAWKLFFHGMENTAASGGGR
jgi:hypothetical protein